MRLLLVEDDLILKDGLERAFTKSGYAVDVIADGDSANKLLAYQEYDVIVLDLGLPKLNGFEVLKRLRARGNTTPVLILTALEDTQNRVKGLDSGADDYLTKPFELAELEARVRALIRRGVSGGSAKIHFGDLSFDTTNRQCFFKEVVLSLSPREVALLELLMLKAAKVVSKTKILEHMCNWDEALSENAIEVNVSRLRKKLNVFGIEIRTIRGLGYLLARLETTA
ncbi:MAG: DNA-binding response regulator [Betaproteobacteria bacterium HGW-Betaproteobacteria-20]|nr:MAG: DNA-binding response regulator [Betaproteobacteria bacterium HGW-Betaproteobacteria-20]